MTSRLYPVRFDPTSRASLWKRTPEQLCHRLSNILRRLGESVPEGSEGLSKKATHTLADTYLHELAHHVALGDHVIRSRYGDTIEVLYTKRAVPITAAIARLGEAGADGHELDAVAVELNAAWWLHFPLSERETVRGASINMNYFTKHAAMAAVKSLRISNVLYDAGYHLATHILSEP